MNETQDKKFIENEIRNIVKGPVDIYIDQPSSSSGLTVLVTDFGACTDPEKCNSEAFSRAIQYCRENNTAKLVVPKGVYYFRTDYGNAPAHIHFKDLKDFVFDGQDSEFVFSVVKNFIKIENCERALFTNFTLDWDWSIEPLASIAKVVEVGENGEYFDFLFPARDIVEEEMKVQIIGPLHPFTLTPGFKGGLEFRPFENKFITNTENKDMDGKMNELVRELSNIIGDRKKIKPNVIRFFANYPDWCRKNMAVDQVYNVRHYEYHANGITFDGSHLTFKKITTYSCPGHGYFGGGSLNHFQILDCKITRMPGTDRTISCTADGCHIYCSQGNFRIENCVFGYSGDDCINFHDNSSVGIMPTGEKTLIAERTIEFHKGDIIEFRKRDLSPCEFSSEITELEYHNDKRRCLLTFADKLPENLDRETILFNRRYNTSNFIIRNNSFHSNRARGMLLQGSDGLIEGNSFYKIQGPAVQVETGVESRWAEGYGVRNIVFRNNWIESCDVNCWSMAVVYMGVYLPGRRTAYPIFSGMIFENNTVVDCPRQAFFLSSCENIILKNNAIINPNTVENYGNRFGQSQKEAPIYGEEYHGTIMIDKASNVLIAANKRIETVDTLDNGIYVGPETKGVLIEDNKGF